MMIWPKADESDQEGGWKISTKFLRQVKNGIKALYPNGEFDHTDWEEIEAVLIVASMLPVED